MQHPEFRNYTGVTILLIIGHNKHVVISPQHPKPHVSESKDVLADVLNCSNAGYGDFRVSTFKREWPYPDNHLERSKYCRHIVPEREAWILALYGRIDDIYFIPSEKLTQNTCVTDRLWQIPRRC